MVINRQRVQASLYSSDRIKDFFVQQKKEDLIKFLPQEVISLACLVDIFGKLNEYLSLQVQAKQLSIFTTHL